MMQTYVFDSGPGLANSTNLPAALDVGCEKDENPVLPYTIPRCDVRSRHVYPENSSVTSP